MIFSLSVIKRDKYNVTEKAKSPINTTGTTLENELERIIRSQAKRYNMIKQ